MSFSLCRGENAALNCLSAKLYNKVTHDLLSLNVLESQRGESQNASLPAVASFANCKFNAIQTFLALHYHLNSR